MTKIEFLGELRKHLVNMTEYEKYEVIADYEEHFVIGASEGRSELEIAQSLGDPELIARQITSSYLTSDIVLEKSDKPKAENNTVKNESSGASKLIIAIALIFLNLTLVVGPYFGIVGFVVGIWGLSIGLTLGGVGIIIGALLKPLLPFLINMYVNFFVGLFLAIGLICLGILGIYLSIYLTQLLIKYTKKYIDFNIELVNKGL